MSIFSLLKNTSSRSNSEGTNFLYTNRNQGVRIKWKHKARVYSDQIQFQHNFVLRYYQQFFTVQRPYLDISFWIICCCSCCCGVKILETEDPVWEGLNCRSVKFPCVKKVMRSICSRSRKFNQSCCDNCASRTSRFTIC